MRVLLDKKVINLSSRGQIILEVVIGIGVIAFFVIGAATLSSISIQAVTTSSKRNQAVGLAQSTVEELKVIRDSDWSELEDPCTSGSPCHTEVKNITCDGVGTEWRVCQDFENHELTLGNSTIIYTEKVILDCALRDKVTGNITAPASPTCSPTFSDTYISDPSTRKATVIISWPEGASTQNIQLIEYFGRYKSSLFTQTDWGGGSGNCDNFADDTDAYCSDDGNIDYNDLENRIKIN